VRVDGGLLFELLGQSMGDPVIGEDDVPVVFRSWQAKNFLVSVMHIKGNVSKSNVLGITEVEVSSKSVKILYLIRFFIDT